MAKRRTWWGNPALRQAITLTEGVGGYPAGFDALSDENAGVLADEFGEVLIGQRAPANALIRDAAAARGIKFGAAIVMSDITGDASYGSLVAQQSSIFAPEAAFAPSQTQNTRGVWTFTAAQSFVNYADSVGASFRWPAGMIYPAHDFSWVSTSSGGVISPVLDGGGQPNINASNWQIEIDNHFNAIAAQSWSSRCTKMNVSNELIDPLQPDGWRVHPWATASGSGLTWLTYAFNKAHALWPNTPLGLCQDLTEQVPDSYYTSLRSWFLTHLQDLLNAGAPISYVDLQGHMAFSRGYDAASHKAFLQAIRSMGLKIIVGEFDIRTGNTGVYVPANYTNDGYDQTAEYLTAQYLDTILPFIDGGEFLCWGMSDKYNAWSASERPLPFDTSFAAKRMASTLLESMAWR